MGAPVIKDDALARPKASRAALLAGAMLVMSLALSLWSWQIIDKQRQASARFDLQRERVVGAIENRMQSYQDILEGRARSVRRLENGQPA